MISAPPDRRVSLRRASLLLALALCATGCPDASPTAADVVVTDTTPDLTSDVTPDALGDATTDLADAVTEVTTDVGPEVDTSPGDVPPASSLAQKCAAKDLESGIQRPEGWEAISHCKYAPADYDVVFGATPQVLQLELHISPADHEAMEADIDDLLKDVGGAFPEPWLTACEGLNPDDPCSVPDGPGTCLDGAGPLVCFPTAFAPPQPMFDACSGADQGASCTVFGDEGVCLYDPLFGLLCAAGQTGPPGEVDNPCFGLAQADPCTLSGVSGSCVVSVAHPDFIMCAVPGFGAANISGVPDEAVAEFFPRKPLYVKTDVVMDGRRWTDVGIRYKGNSSLASSSALRRPFRLEFDQFEDDVPSIDDQRMFGFKELSFTSNHLDSSFLNQFAATRVFELMGVPSPRATPVVVSLRVGDGSPQQLGLYTMTEIPGKPMLDRLFGEDDGNLYKPDGRGAHLVSYVEASFHKKSNKAEQDFSDVQGFVAALHTGVPGEASWREGLEAHFEMNGFIRFLAVNQAIGNWDTYGGFAHNFYLYATEASSVLHFLPWDFDLAFYHTGPNDPSLLSFDGSWPLIQAVAHDPVYYERYHEELVDVYGALYAEDTLATDVAAWRAVISDDAMADVGAGAFVQGSNSLDGHITQQKQALGAYLQGAGFTLP